MRLFELKPDNPIDRELQNTAQGVQDDGSLDPNDMDMGDENTPDPSMQGAMPDEPVDPLADKKPVDSALMALVQGHDYIQNHQHDDPAASHHPSSIMSLDMEGLTDLRRRARVMADTMNLQDRTGGYQNPERKTLGDLLAFVDLIMMHQKTQVKDEKRSSKNRPTVRNQKPPKTESGRQFSAKRQ